MDWDSIIRFDKDMLLLVNGSDSLFIDGLATTLTTATTWIPLYVALFYLVLRNSESMKQILLIVSCAALCVLLAGTVDDTFVKPNVARFRPTHDSEIGFCVDIVDGYRGGRYGFFSAHAANTFSIAVFFSFLVRNKILTFFLLTWSLLNCWTRMYLGVHYPGDILCGLLWGGISGLVIYFLYFKINTKMSNGMRFISSQYTSTGYQQIDVDIVINVLILLFIYSIIRACMMMA